MFLDGSLVVDMTRNRSLPTAPEQVIGVCTMEAAHDGSLGFAMCEIKSGQRVRIIALLQLEPVR